MIALTHKTGWAVQITRADGSKVFACSGHGTITPTWPRNQKKYAVSFKNDLRKHDINARVVAVTYAHPVEIPKS